MRKLLADHWLIFLPITLLIVLYFPVFNTYFSHDDFFHFNIGRTDGTLAGFFDLFAVKPWEARGYGFYRQLGREALFYIYYSIFGLSHIPFRVVAMLLQVINLSLVYFFIYDIFKKKHIAIFTASMFALSTSNVAVLFYLAGGFQMQMVVFFAFISLFAFRQYLLKRDIWMRMLAALAFLAALASHELAIAIPFLLAIYSWMKLKRPFGEMVIYIATELLIFWYLLFAFLYIDIFVIGHPRDQVQYHPTINPKKLANTLMWYAGWGLGLPQMLVDFITSGFGVDPRLMRFWGDFYSVIFPSFFLGLLLLGILKLKLFFKSKKNLLNKFTFGFVLWFLACVGPMLVLPEHKQAHYLSLALVGLWAVVGYILFIANKGSKLLIWGIVISFAILNVTAIQLSKVTYPAVQRGRIAKDLMDDMQNQYPTLSKGAAVYVQNDPNYPFIAEEWGGSAKQASFVLSNQNAFQVLYNDPTLHVYYEGETQVEDIPQDYYPFVARISL